MRACVQGVATFLALTATMLVVLAGNASAWVGSIAPPANGAGSELDCNGWSPIYPPARPAMRELCTDPIQINSHGKAYRFNDNGHYVGHDEPSVKFISSTPCATADPCSGNTMTYYTQLPVDPAAAPTANGSVTDYNELSVAPWFGLPMCDPDSYPQNSCTADSDSNTGSGLSTDAGSAFMELQFYPPGFTPWIDAESCSTTKWCSALTIDSLECTFDFASCNGACEEPFNFAWLQQNGVPTGPASPQDQDFDSFTPDSETLEMNPGDVLKVTITDPSSGFTTTVEDLTTGQTGFMQASAANGFANTNIADCSGNPFTWHAEYSTASQQNEVPWAAAEGGVLMEQEIGHFESCNSVVNKDPFSVSYPDGSAYSDQDAFDTCDGGLEGPGATGEGACSFVSPTNEPCSNATTQGFTGPTACPNENAGTSDLCEYADGFCFQAGERTAMVTNGGPATPVTESSPLNGCFANRWQNGDLDFDGNPYQASSWPGGGSNVPTSIRYAGPFMSNGDPYAQVQFESDIPGSEDLCDTTTGQDCTVPPISADFYPYWSLNYSQTLAGSGLAAGSCVWDFGQDIPGVTNNDFGGEGEYGSPDVARYGGTAISGIRTNPATLQGCGAPTATGSPPISGTAQQGQTLTESHTTWSDGSTAYSYLWEDCDSSGSNCSLIGGATAQTYTPSASDVGHTIRVQEDVPGADGTTGRATSSQTAVVSGAPPANVSPPQISGNTTQGQTLTESHGTYTNSPTSFGYQWEDCNTFGLSCSPIKGAMSQTYTLTPTDVGHTIVVQETATNATGPSPSNSSAATAEVAPASGPALAPSPTSGAVITGTTRVGATLSTTTGLWSGTPPLAYTYQWQRCKPGCTNIGGATGTSYTMTTADFGALIDVAVTATNSLGSATMTSGEEGPVGPSVAQIKSLLGKLLVPHGKPALIPALLAKGGYSFSFTTPGAGQLIVDWTRGSALVASVTVSFGKAGKVKSVLLLTLKGGHVLIGATHLKLSAKGTFTPASLPATLVKKTIRLKS